jgi:hypothetical protein
MQKELSLVNYLPVFMYYRFAIPEILVILGEPTSFSDVQDQVVVLVTG